MAFTEHQFDQAAIAALAQEKAEGLKRNRGLSNFLGFGLGVVAQRLAQDRRRYLDYGMYWWPLKAIMRDAGYDMGSSGDPLVAQAYAQATPEQTLVAADEFRTWNLANNFKYTDRYMLDSESGEWWTLYDPDMELPH